MADDYSLLVSDKPDSQDICFVTSDSYRDLINNMQPEINKEGNIFDINGNKIGIHKGIANYTIGQRKGLAVGGTPEPLFVIDTDVVENVVYVGQGKSHPGLFRNALKVNLNDIHWVRQDLSNIQEKKMEVMARIRYRQTLQKATLFFHTDALYVLFNQPQSAITSGQFVAWYKDSELLGSGVIA